MISELEWTSLVPRCQTEEFREDCTTKRYRDTLLQTYSCAPAYMRSYYGSQVCSITNVQAREGKKSFKIIF